MNYVVDTCIFNKLIDGEISLGALPQRSSFFASHIQIDEINKTPDAERKAQLFLKFAEIRPKIIPAESMVWGFMRWGQMKWSDGELYKQLKQSLDKLSKSKRSNISDALIAETAINNRYILLTTDELLSNVATELGCEVQFFKTK